MSLAEGMGLAPVAGKTYKVFLVEVDDDDRERVLAATGKDVNIKVDVDYSDIHTNYDSVLRRYVDSQTVTLNMRLIPNQDGTYIRIEDFSQGDDNA